MTEDRPICEIVQEALERWIDVANIDVSVLSPDKKSWGSPPRLTNPWPKRMCLHICIYHCKNAIHAHRKKLGLPRQRWK